MPIAPSVKPIADAINISGKNANPRRPAIHVPAIPPIAADEAPIASDSKNPGEPFVEYDKPAPIANPGTARAAGNTPFPPGPRPIATEVFFIASPAPNIINGILGSGVFVLLVF
ncbi:MAG: hypothetical protein KZQ73_00030 [Candidatus Thiodiazotropha sp. (ex Semelilucina semeliformis)]|nr:hypothetical protein [Candidatus Thiodiazotropha sp. (ex Semelilucina semeliformis)]